MQNILNVNEASGIIIKSKYNDKDFILTANHSLDDIKENNVVMSKNINNIQIQDILRNKERDIAILIINKIEDPLENIEFSLKMENSILWGYSGIEKELLLKLNINSLSQEKKNSNIHGIVDSSTDFPKYSLEEYLHGFSGGPLISEVNSKKICNGILLKTSKHGALNNIYFAPYTLFEELLLENNFELDVIDEIIIKGYIKQVEIDINNWIAHKIEDRFNYEESLKKMIEDCNKNIKLIKSVILNLKTEKKYTQDEVIKLMEFLIIHRFVLENEIVLENEEIKIALRNNLIYFGNKAMDFDLNIADMKRLIFNNKNREDIHIINICNLSDMDNGSFQCDECEDILKISNSYLFQDFTKAGNNDDNFCRNYTYINKILFCCADCFIKTKYKKGEKKINELYKKKQEDKE